jgi:uncharacterized cupredoxin-like copper-binding protein
MQSRGLWGRVSILSPSFAWTRLLLFMPLALTPFPADAQSALTVPVEMTEFAFHPSTIRLPAGRLVTLVFVNRGQLAHQFETAYLLATPAVVVNNAVRVEAVGVELVRLQPGTTARMTFLPTARGRFSFACTIEGHQEAGMRGALEVR